MEMSRGVQGFPTQTELAQHTTPYRGDLFLKKSIRSQLVDFSWSYVCGASPLCALSLLQMFHEAKGTRRAVPDTSNFGKVPSRRNAQASTSSLWVVG